MKLNLTTVGFMFDPILYIDGHAHDNYSVKRDGEFKFSDTGWFTYLDVEDIGVPK